MVGAIADRAFLPAKNLFEQVGNMMILTGKTFAATVRPPYPYGGEFIGQFLFALQLCWFPMAVSMVAVSFGAPGPAGGQLPLPVRRPGPPRRLLHPRLGARVRAVRERDHRRRRRRDRDHRRPRGAQDPRGARRAAGARRRPDQEPRRPALPRPDADHRAARRLRDHLRDLRRRDRRGHVRPAARAASSPPCSTTPRSPTCGRRCSNARPSARSWRWSAVTRG